MDAHLDRKATIPTTWFLSEITENNTEALYNSCRGTTKATEKNIEKKFEISCIYETHDAGVFLHELLGDSKI